MKIALIAAALAASTASAAYAQDVSPDGSEPAVSFEPYVGLLGGYHNFDRRSEFGTVGPRGKMDGALIEGVAGINMPLGPVFVGVEGNVAKGFKDIDWEYGVKGRFGARAGQSGLIYVSTGYQWVNGRKGFQDHSDMSYGVGVEVGPKEIGLGGVFGEAGPRLRLEATTYDFDSIRPMAGVVFAF
ncbi:opacity protein [Sphingomonas montanisoli]|uniref:Opacity protein n=1 Tax=Sphingomonas montanisoli TaxID=2606412 RepID=A0A5D9C6U1_9SPHN|nr:opacity protein [Sphingomonas montanisoli]TZG27514.1 opacity protein [Sphingomonas montanisoli]